MHHSIASLEAFAAALYVAAGMDADKAQSLARLQVLTDAMGRRTHGLAMAPQYLAELRQGILNGSGSIEVLRDNGISALWNANYLPGQWVIEQAIQTAMPRAATHGIAAISVRASHHIGCLAALVKGAADRGFVAMVSNSNPSAAYVAPYGGTEALLTPDPFAVGYPGDTHPVLVDISASITSVSMTRQKAAAGEQFEHPWLLDAQGQPSRDPAVLEQHAPRGTLQWIGGADHGHKGFGLALMVEALSQGLSGQGRKNPPKRRGGYSFVQVIDPALFAGAEPFAEQMNYLSERCRSNRPARPGTPVRMPGDQAARGIEHARAQGIAYEQTTWQALRQCAQDLGVALPST